MSDSELSDFSEDGNEGAVYLRSYELELDGELASRFNLMTRQRSRSNPDLNVRYVPLLLNVDEDDDDDNNEDHVPPLLGPPVDYDQNLTPAHKYLGDGLHETTGRTVFEEGVTHSIPVIFLQLNLIPGQILPIIARSPHVKFILKYALARNRVFGVSYKLNIDTPTYGTIAEIYEHSVDIESAHSFQIKAMGHQRYEIVRTNTFEGVDQPINLIALSQIKIIPDIILAHPFKELCLHPKTRTSNHHSAVCRKRDMWQTQWPDWVYRQFDVYTLASQVSTKVKMLYKDVKIAEDPTLLSLQVTKLGILNQEQVSYLLGLASTNLRLQYILQYWEANQSMQKFMCVRCCVPICNMSKVFPMSLEGPQGTYCNSWGQIHDMITVTELDENVEPLAIGSPSTECCWFPGYKWVIILCPTCHYHLGWRYLVDESQTLVPRMFYGLSMQSITTNNNHLHPPQLILDPFAEEERSMTL